MTYYENNTDKRPWQWGCKNYFSNTFARIFLLISLGVLFVSLSQTIEFLLLSVFLIIITVSTFKASKLWEWIFILGFSMFLFLLGGILAQQALPPSLSQNGNRIESRQYSTLVVDITSPPIRKEKHYRTETIIRATIGSHDLYQNSIYHNLDRTKKDKTIEKRDTIEKENIYRVGERLILNFANDSLCSEPKLGDRYVVSVRPKLPSPTCEGGFDYGKYLVHHGFSGVAWVSNNRYKLLSRNNITGIRMHLYSFREQLINRYKQLGLNGESLSILSAITLGDKGQLTDSTKTTFNAAGISHILVVSGMHIGFIYIIIVIVLRKLYAKRLRILWICLGLLVLWFYALLTGLSPSVVRASFMFSMMLIMRINGTRYRVHNALALSAVILLITNPFVIYDIGFQLSYLAVISITYFYPHFTCAINKLQLSKHIYTKPIEWILLTAALSVSAQILTIPVVLYNFHQFPIYFIITNLVISLIAPIIFLGGLSLIPLSFIPYVGTFCATLMRHLLNFISWEVNAISALPLSVVKQYMSLTECLLLFIVILSVVNWIETRKYFIARFNSRAFMLVSIFAFLSVVTFNNWRYSRKEQLAYLNGNSLVVSHFSHDSNIVYTCADTAFVISRLEPLWLKYNAPKPIFITDSSIVNNYFKYKDETYLVLKGNPFKYTKNPPTSLQVDNLIIGKGLYPSERLFDDYISTHNLIITPSVYPRYIERFKKIALKRGIAVDIIE